MATNGRDRMHAALLRARFEVIPTKGVERQLDHLPPHAVVTVTNEIRRAEAWRQRLLARYARTTA